MTAGDGPTLKAVMHLVDEGVEHALEERSRPWGRAREGALLAALRVLVTALQTDGWLLQELRQYPKSGGQYTVDDIAPGIPFVPIINCNQIL